jgi:hypothetical protein
MTTRDPIHPELEAVEIHGMNRASFLLKGALGAGALFGASAVTPFVSNALAAGASSDVDILNFALMLEYLETDFYQSKGRRIGLSGKARSYARSFGAEEAEHVAALTKAIKAAGGKPVKKPTFSFPVSDQKSFLKLAYTLENVGVGAYNGAGPLLKSKELLIAAGEIVQIEARHAATVAVITHQPITPHGAFDKALTKKQVLAKAGPLIKG